MKSYRIIRRIMSEKTFNQLLGFIMVAVVFLLLSFPAMAEGFSLMSISWTDINSNDPDLENSNVIVTIAADGGGGELRITPQDFENSGVYTNSNVKFNIGSVQHTAVYPALNQGNLWKYKHYFIDRTDFFKGAECPPAPAYCFIVSSGNQGLGKDRILVVEKQNAGNLGGIQNPYDFWKVPAAVSIDGKTETKDIRNGDAAKGTVRFSKFPVTMKTIGMTGTGMPFPDQYPYVLTHPTDAKQWSVAPRSEYIKYTASLGKVDTLLYDWTEQEKKYSSWRESQTENSKACTDTICSTVTNPIKEHNIIVDKFLKENVQISYTGATVKNQAQGTDGNIYQFLDVNIGNPVFILTFQAKALSLYVPVGEPEIITVDAPETKSGDANGIIKIKFRNSGAYEGTFAARVNGTVISKSITVKPGETAELTLFLEPSLVFENIMDIVEVYDVNSGTNDTQEYTKNVSEPRAYIPNDTRFERNTLIVADAEGKKEYKEIDCSKGTWVIATDGSYECKQVNDVKLTTYVNEPPKPYAPLPLIEEKPAPKTAPDYTIFILALVILIVLCILVVLVSNAFSSGGRSKKGLNPSTFVILGLVIVIVILLVVQYWETALLYVNEFMFNLFMKEILK